MDVQRAGGGRDAALVVEPRTRGRLLPCSPGRSEAVERGQAPPRQLGRERRVGVQQQIGEVLVGAGETGLRQAAVEREPRLRGVQCAAARLS